MLCKEVIVLCSEIHTKHLNEIQYANNTEFFMLKLVVNIVTSLPERYNYPQHVSTASDILIGRVV
jgi:hypothetical protein